MEKWFELNHRALKRILSLPLSSGAEEESWTDRRVRTGRLHAQPPIVDRAASSDVRPLVLFLMMRSQGGYSLLFGPPDEEKSSVAHQAAILGVDCFSGIVQRWIPAALKSRMVLKFRMVCSGAVILAWVDLPDNDQRVCSDTANVGFHVVFKQSEPMPDSSPSSPASAGFQ